MRLLSGANAHHCATAAVVLAGLVVAAVLAAAAGTPRRDTVVLVGLATVGAVAASAAGWVVLRCFRRRSVRTQALVVAFSSLVATVTGVTVATVAMFISTHDLQALVVVLVASSAVSVGAAIQLGDGSAPGRASCAASPTS